MSTPKEKNIQRRKLDREDTALNYRRLANTDGFPFKTRRHVIMWQKGETPEKT